MRRTSILLLAAIPGCTLISKVELDERLGWWNQVSAGFEIVCGLRGDGTVACWGAGFTAEPEPTDELWVQVDAGYQHACALSETGRVECFANADDIDARLTMPEGKYRQISAGGFDTCGLREDGTIACTGETSEVVDAVPEGDFVQVDVGEWYACALKSDPHAVVCWGLNDYGEAEASAGDYVQVSAWHDHSCARDDDGAITCWGAAPYFEPTLEGDGWEQVEVGFVQTVGLDGDGALTCVGDISGYELEDTPNGTFVQVDCGSTYCCALSDEGEIACWGNTALGQADIPEG